MKFVSVAEVYTTEIFSSLFLKNIAAINLENH